MCGLNGLFLMLVFTAFALPSRCTRCLENGRFYRDTTTERPDASRKTGPDDPDDCAKYFLCLEGEVFEFKCSSGLLFDVNRQICDFRSNVDNCDVVEERSIPKPLLEEANCEDEYELGCADGSCLPEEYFCDGSVDCADGSDEGHCELYDDPNSATKCRPGTCKLPDCFCSKDGTQIPDKLDTSQTPQMVLLNFDDAVNFDNFDLYSKVLFGKNRTNPNGCPILATFFISHQYNNYQQTQRLWNQGHEIAVHSITHRGPEDWWSSNATIEDYFDEMVGQANILHKFSAIRLSDMKGMRVPFLRVGWNRQFLMAKEFGFLYDSSIVAPFSDPPLWPYTLDYALPHQCYGPGQNCPTRPHPGIWEIVINPLIKHDQACVTIEKCSSKLTAEEVYKMLHHNFKRHYLTNRAPFGLNFHSTWFKDPEYLHAFEKFLDEILQQPDVWFITNTQAIEWMQNPTPVNKLQHFTPWNCNRKFKPSELTCTVPNTCKLHSRVFQQERYFHTCSPCPPKYPWVRNEFGLE